MRLEHPDFANQVLAHLFQFHKGAIRTKFPQRSFHSILHFNSIKVRLEHDMRAAGLNALLFQFHKGAIRTYDDGQVREFLMISIP